MKISKEDIRQVAKDFISVLDRENIKTTNDLEKRVGCKVSVDYSEDFVSLTLRPSNSNTNAYTLRYIRPGTGIPLELKINPQLKYSQVILKAQEVLQGYSMFASDIFGNIAQTKLIKSSDFSVVKEEVKKLGSV